MATILVVEDNRDNMNLIEEILEDEGYAILMAFIAEEGIALLKDNVVDLILMDISLPQMSGIDATKLIKSDEQTRQIPLIILTAHAHAADRDEAFEAGCDDFLTKPIDEDLLLETIKNNIHQETSGASNENFSC